MQDLQEPLQPSRVLIATVVVSFILLLAAAGLTLRVSGQADAADRWVVHTMEVKQTLMQLETQLAGAESGQRGYLITGEARFQQPFDAAAKSVPALVTKLRALVADDPGQQAKVDAVAPLIERRLQTIRETLELARQDRDAEAAAIVRTFGSHLMNDIHAVLDALDSVESRLLTERRQSVAAIRTEFTAAVTVMLAASALLTILSLVSMRRYIAGVDASRRRLAAYNTELEAKVAERTAELRGAAEVAQRERNRAEALLTDVNHRVGNNLALVSSFLTMQQRMVKSPEAARALNAARARVQAIASAHRKLRLGEDFATVKANEVLGAVLDDICAGLPPGDLIKVTYQLAPLEISARDAVSLGVLTSELVMNAAKHAFSPGESGEISVVFGDVGAQVPYLEVIDDGVGWHEKHTQESNGLGTKIIDMVARQFGGTAQRSVRRQEGPRPGTRIRIDLGRLQLIQPS
jgi:two-component sensor histidine kinase/CHASE3 domain sensor protein